MIIFSFFGICICLYFVFRWQLSYWERLREFLDIRDDNIFRKIQNDKKTASNFDHRE